MKGIPKGFKSKMEFADHYFESDRQQINWEATGYIITESGVFIVTDNGEKMVNSIPIYPSKRAIDTKTSIERIELRYYKDFKWQEKIVSLENISTVQNIIKNLSDYGIGIYQDNAKSMVTYLNTVLNQCRGKMDVLRLANSLGWNEGDFVPYADDICIDGAKGDKFIINAVKSTRGKVDEVINFCKEIRKNKALAVMLCASFAAPLINILGENSFFVHLNGKTGTGKTIALKLAASVWGNPTGLITSFNSTNNALIAKAAFLNNFPVFIDELQALNKKDTTTLDSLIMTFTEGIERGRLNVDSQQKEQREWHTVFITTGEQSLLNSNSGGGTFARVCDIAENNALFAEFGKASSFLERNHGLLGEQFITYLQDLLKADENAFITKYENIRKEIETTLKTTTKQTSCYAVLLFADELTAGLFWDNERSLTIEDIQRYIFADSTVDISDRAYEFIKSHISSNLANFIDDSNSSPLMPRNNIWGKIEINSAKEIEKCYFNKKILDEELKAKNYNITKLLNIWLERGYIEAGTEKTQPYRHKKTINGVPLTTVCFRKFD